MRKHWMLLPLLVLLLALPLGGASADITSLDDEPLGILAQERWAGWQVAQVTDSSGMPLEEYAYSRYDSQCDWAVTVLQSGESTLLCLLQRGAEGWMASLRHSGFSLGGGRVPFVWMESRGAFDIGWYGDGGTVSLRFSFELGGKGGREWLLRAVETEENYIEVSSSKLTYHSLLTGRNTTVSGVVMTQLSQVFLSNFPLTATQARHKLSNPPAIASFEGAMTVPQPMDVRFPANATYPVYAGPGETYVRGAEGKALVSANDWVQVFGYERQQGRDWLLVQYAINPSHMRFGWIQAEVPGQNSPLWLYDRWLWMHATAVAPLTLTDDPLFSRSALVTLPEGTPLTLLALLNDSWYYLQAESEQGPVRGFAPVNDSALRPEQTLLSEAQCRAIAEEALLNACPEFAWTPIESLSTIYWTESETGRAVPYYQFIWYISDKTDFFEVEVHAQSGAVMLVEGLGGGNG